MQVTESRPSSGVPRSYAWVSKKLATGTALLTLDVGAGLLVGLCARYTMHWAKVQRFTLLPAGMGLVAASATHGVFSYAYQLRHRHSDDCTIAVWYGGVSISELPQMASMEIRRGDATVKIDWPFEARQISSPVLHKPAGSNIRNVWIDGVYQSALNTTDAVVGAVVAT